MEPYIDIEIKRDVIETECIFRYGYDKEHRILELEFNSGYGYVYRYYDVPEEVATKLLETKNGHYFNKYVRDVFNFKRYGGPDSLDLDKAICYNILTLF